MSKLTAAEKKYLIHLLEKDSEDYWSIAPSHVNRELIKKLKGQK